MAVRGIRTLGDPILRKKSRKVDRIDDRIIVLLDDMMETMKQEDGVGLAAPQVGVLRQVITIDVGEGAIELINPVLIEAHGGITREEGCLSIPGKVGLVERPEKVVVKGLNRKGEEVKITGEGLLARALCHEIDHLNGILFIDRITDEESR